MGSHHMFLMGGGPPMPRLLAKRLSVLKQEGAIVVLYIERELMSIHEYKDDYKDAFLQYDNQISFTFIDLKESYTPNELQEIQSAGAVIIGGGDTVKYHKYIIGQN
ncbi:hypothetical protein [Halobacillus sp. Marseille-Q1614]|uniref:hypothetical protein n=1 Tax=Halobacillus sp. Marseille-Q1614 TaxID=2709134 RepID=UPI00156D79F1|nr:hypothetical protein [Halobacillus sp. Marseille-Q1614]